MWIRVVILTCNVDYYQVSVRVSWMSLEQKLELARLELLDMGLRGNPLLSIPKTMNFLEVVEERSENVFQIVGISTSCDEKGLNFMER